MEKQARAKKSSNLLSGFAAARKRHGVTVHVATV
jgi:hypothetical protein